MATAGSDRKRKERKGGRREEGRVSLVSLKPKVRVEQGGGDGWFVLFGNKKRGEAPEERKEKKMQGRAKIKMHMILCPQL